MVVTEITEVSKAKWKICIDYEFAFVLYKGELRKYHIKLNENISEETYHEIIDEVLNKRAKLRCMNLLQSRDYTTEQLRIKLQQGMYPQEVIDKAIEYVAGYRYLDDMRYAKSYINYAGQSKSRRQIELDLLRKGVSKQDIQAAYESCEEEDMVVVEEDLIRTYIEKKRYNKAEATAEEYRKMINFLYRKGFSLDKIYNVLGEKD